jgi:hypothetical protein
LQVNQPNVFNLKIEKRAFGFMPKAIDDMDESKTSLIHGQIFSISSYKDHSPTVQVLLSDGSVFSYLPLHSLVSTQEPTENHDFELKDCFYHNCPSNEFVVHEFYELSGICQVFIKSRNKFYQGMYILTIDWFEDNNMLHLIELDNGAFVMIPSHKIQFGKYKSTKFPEYKKLRQEWKI